MGTEIDRPEVLMVGATGRNAGKTTFACEVIRHNASRHPIVAAKVTTVAERDGTCPRGGKGCGVCSSLTGNYCLTRETDEAGGKDTARLKQAGAAAVYWLRVHRPFLREGLAALLAEAPPRTGLVMESNSARTALKPGLFLIAREDGVTGIKASCREVSSLADLTVTFDGRGWDTSPSACVFDGHCWRLRPNAAAIILAGGTSRRMGQDKALLPVDGKPLIQHLAEQLVTMFPHVMVGARTAAQYGFLGLDVVSDRVPGAGPLMGLLSCLERSPCDLNFVMACDIPQIDWDLVFELLRHAENADVAMPVDPAGRHEPLFAVYRRSVIPVAADALRRGERRVIAVLPHVRSRMVPIPAVTPLTNLNTPSDYQAFVESAATGERA